MSAAGYITDVAYIPGFYPQMAPVALRHVAVLNGVAPPRVAGGFRYLELGCGLGRVVSTLAAANPAGEFIGVDVNPEHTAAAGREIAAAGLTNARVLTADVASLTDDLGEFEFIALHGVFSWVGPDVRERLLDVARRHLAPGGLLLVSYNAMPGWAHLQPIRGILRQYAALRQGDSVQRIRDALAYLVFLRDRQAKYFVDNPRASAYIDALLTQDPRYLAHEYLNSHWTSFYFAEVAEMFRDAGLQFVGSQPTHTNFWDLCVRPEFQELFRTTRDRLVTEAHKDFCANTAFRWDVYAKSPQPLGGFEGRLAIADDLHFRVARAGTTLPFQANLGVVTSTVDGPLYAALLDVLSGESLPLSRIVADARLAGTTPADLARAVDAGVALGLFEVSAGGASPSDAAVGGDPSWTIPLAFNRVVIESDALGGRPVALASLRTGTGHTIGDLDAAILHEIAAGGLSGLVDRMARRLAASGRTLQRDGKAVHDPTEQHTLVEAACTAFTTLTLPRLASLGIVVDRPATPT
ncbi:MAG: methyltransferase regulatory domain-containing protein [Planctomycetaceae bacterium]